MSNGHAENNLTLAQVLEKHIMSKLMLLQATYRERKTNAVVGDVIDAILNPLGNPYGLINRAAGRMSDVTDELQRRMSDGQLPTWVIPRVAAFAFEAVFEGCVAFWVAKGQPKSQGALDPSVEKFVRAQVALFTAMIGSK